MVLASWILRRRSIPSSWRVVGAVLVVVWWSLAAAILTAADPARGV